MSLVAALCGIIAYAAGNVIMAHKLSGVSPFITITVYSFFVAVTTFGAGRVASGMGYAVPFPSSTVLPWLIFIGILMVIGDIAYVSAYGIKNASMATITTCAALIPVFATIIEKLCIGGTPPSLRTMCGFALAVFTVWVVAFDPANIPIKH